MQGDARRELDTLMARLGSGDRSAFPEVFRLLWPATLRLCTSLLEHEADAADAAQQAMIKILERASDYDRSRPALPWAMAIAAWECRTIKRWRFRRREGPIDALDQVADGGGEQEMITRDLLKAAATALGELSDRDRETLNATVLEEAGPVGGATFRKRRERALTRLRAKLRNLYGIGD